MVTIKRLSLLLVLSALLVFAIQTGCDDLITERLTVIEAGHPIADFSLISPEDGFGCAPCTAIFADSSDGPRHMYIWNFGEGTPDTNYYPENPTDYVPDTHIYQTPGIYTVSLKIIDTTLDGEDTEVKPHFIYVGTTNADFVAIPSPACPGEEVSFFPASYDEQINYVWYFGDGSDSSESAYPRHIYQDSGSFTVSLKLTDSCGEATSTATFVVGKCPVVSFVAADSSGCNPFSVNFHDSTETFGLSVISRDWDFGDGGTSAERDPIHEYTQTGSYTVKLTVETDGGISTDSVVDFITVVDQTIANFNVAGDTEFCKSDFQQFQVNFLNQSSGAPESFLWRFGDGFTDTATNPVHVYTTPGIYSCTLEATGPCGTHTAIRDSFIVLADTLLDGYIVIDWDTTYNGEVVPPVTATFTDASTQGVRTSWEWFVDEASTSTSPEFQTVLDAGTYKVKLVVTNQCGVAAADSVEITVPAP